MRTAKAPRVPVLDNAFEVNLPKLMKVARATGSSRLVLDGGDVRTVAVLAETRLAVFLGGRDWVVDIVPVQCLQGRVRPLLKCPRAHEGNFQTLYWWKGDLACRHCLGLRYRSTLGASATARNRIARHKLLQQMGGGPGIDVPDRPYGCWRKKHARDVIKLGGLTQVHYRQLKTYLDRTPTGSSTSQHSNPNGAW
jgi:hypothetical protein